MASDLHFDDQIGRKRMEQQGTKEQGRLSPEEIAEQASKPDHDQIFRQPRRGDETIGDPDDRFVAGAPDHEDTPHGREERKHQVEEEAEESDDR
jgi:hypothetical protein